MMIMNRDECSKQIDAFLAGTCGDYDWDDFISTRSTDPDIKSVIDYCSNSRDIYPPEKPGNWCGAVGATKLAELSRLLKSNDEKAVRDFINIENQNAELRASALRR